MGERASEPANETTEGTQSTQGADPVIVLHQVAVILDGSKILGPLTWRIHADQHWVVLGPNGGGKSTLLRIASLAQHPTEGRVTVLGHELGRVDIRRLRARVGVSSASLVDQLRASLTAEEIVRCGLHAALEPWWHQYQPQDTHRAEALLAQVGLADYGTRTFATLSSGERQRTLLARTLMSDPDVLLLDEPTAGVDLGGREALVAALDSIAVNDGPATVFVTHHVEDIPGTTTHLLAIADGQAVASGPINEVLSGQLLTDMFKIPVKLRQTNDRWTATAQPSETLR